MSSAIGLVAMVDIVEVAQRIINAEKTGKRLSKKTIFRLCGYDRSIMREVFRRVRIMNDEKEKLTNWLD